MEREETESDDREQQPGGEDSRSPSRGVGRWMGSRLASVLMILMLGASLSAVTACEKQSKMDEAMEEVEDEFDDAKKAVEDEIDDHS